MDVAVPRNYQLLKKTSRDLLIVGWGAPEAPQTKYDIAIAPGCMPDYAVRPNW